MLDFDRWKGKVALVSGASSGMGEEIARRLAAGGMRVALSARRADRLEALARELTADGGEVLPIPTDLRHEESLRGMFGAIRDRWGGVDVLINNAGLGWAATLKDGTSDDWREMLDVNILALTVCMREALADMSGKADAHIINISSSTARMTPPNKGLAFYSATKRAVNSLTEGLRDELLEQGSKVKIANLSPGLTETGFHVRFFRDEEAARDNYAHFQPLAPSDVADAVIYVLSTPPNVQVNELIFRPLGQFY